jgi:penicillin-binding protein 1A
VKAFSDGVTYKATQILEDNVQAGTGTHANYGCPAAGKTGTTDLNTDAWFVGFTPKLSTAVWVGYPNSRTEMNGLYYGRNVDGGTFPADIWGAYMKMASGGYCGSFPLPKNPFVSSPFFGHYSQEPGSSSSSSSGSTTTPGTTTPAPTTTSTPTPSTGGTGTQQGTGGAFNPNAYESPPQGPPATGNGGGNGNGNGNGGTGTQGAATAPPGTTP